MIYADNAAAANMSWTAINAMTTQGDALKIPSAVQEPPAAPEAPILPNPPDRQGSRVLWFSEGSE